MPRQFVDLKTEFAKFWDREEPGFAEYRGDVKEDDKVLNVFALGLGGPYESEGLLRYLGNNYKKYDKIFIFAFGEDLIFENKSWDVLETIEKMFSQNFSLPNMVKTFFFDMFLPTIHRTRFTRYRPTYSIPKYVPYETIDFSISDDTEITYKNFMDLQMDGASFNVYKPPQLFYKTLFDKTEGIYKTTRIDETEVKEYKDDIILIMEHFTQFFEKYPRGELLIDNNAFIRTSTNYSNINFEFMPWLPMLLKINQKKNYSTLLIKAASIQRQFPFSRQKPFLNIMLPLFLLKCIAVRMLAIWILLRGKEKTLIEIIY
jgi:hypothetical protein